MCYEWDEEKNRLNQRKHGISFEMAAVVLLVVHIYREEAHGEEITRIISARKAEKNEIRRYQEPG